MATETEGEYPFTAMVWKRITSLTLPKLYYSPLKFRILNGKRNLWGQSRLAIWYVSILFVTAISTLPVLVWICWHTYASLPPAYTGVVILNWHSVITFNTLSDCIPFLFLLCNMSKETVLKSNIITQKKMKINFVKMRKVSRCICYTMVRVANITFR